MLLSLGLTVVSIIDPIGGLATPRVRSNKEPVKYRVAHKAVGLPSASGAFCFRGQYLDPSTFFKGHVPNALHEFEVLHHFITRKAAETLERATAHGEGLVTVPVR
jgi:hypothetical protein